MASLAFRTRQASYDLRTGLLFRPAWMTLAFATAGILLPWLELRGSLGPVGRAAEAVFPHEPGAAQVVLSVIAGSSMTVVSIVYSVLLMALSLASIQFSPRILRGLVRDRASQTTLGLFIGTFVYCLLVLRAVRADPPEVPPASVIFAGISIIAALSWLIYFIDRVATSIQANHLVARIVDETREVLVETHPPIVASASDLAWPTGARSPVAAPSRGYIQLVDESGLLELADRLDLTIEIAPYPGDFVIAGAPLAFAGPPDRVTAEVRRDIGSAFDLGHIRTMQHDAEFGVRQIVDIALKAISPAVNDPSTAVTCIDNLAALLSELVQRASRPAVLAGASGAPRVRAARVEFRRLLDLAFNQIRQYGTSDISVSVRVLRALGSIALFATRAEDRARILHHAKLVRDGLSAQFLEPDREAVTAAYLAVERACGEPDVDGSSSSVDASAT